MRRFDKIMGSVVVVLSVLTLGSLVLDEQTRDRDRQQVRAEDSRQREALAAEVAARRMEAEAARERAREAEANADRLREALIALALADTQEDRRAVLALFAPGMASAPTEGPEAGSGQPGAPTRPSSDQANGDPRREPAPTEPAPPPPSDPGPIQGPVEPLVPDAVEDPLERLIGDLTRPACTSIVCLPHP